VTTQHALRWFNITTAGTVDNSFKNRCPHCRNSSFVLPDASRVAWPCPMCALGRARANEYATGNLVPSDSVADEPTRPQSQSGRTEASFFDGASLHGLAWEGGLTIAHRFYCVTTGCDELVTQMRQECGQCITETSSEAVSA